MKQYQLFDELVQSEYESLKSSVADCGILVPVELDEKGNILDGHHRVKVAKELGIKDYPTIVRIGLTEEGKRNHVRILNLLRRHLSKEQRNKTICDMRADGMNTVAIAQAIGVPQRTVHDVVSTEQFSESAKLTGKDGKKYPTTKKPHTRKPRQTAIVAKNAQETERAIDAASKVENLPGHLIDVKRAERIAREEAAKARAESVTPILIRPTCQCYLGDFRDFAIPSNVDLIFTDPPYDKDSLPLWNDLSEFANKALKPNGMLIAYSGAMYLPQVIQSLSKSLTFWWCGSVTLKGLNTRVSTKNIMQSSKPLLFFVRDGFEPTAWIDDTIESERPEKDAHDWQQSLAPALYYINKLTPQDGLVIDPFLGGGTTGVAAIRLGRRFIGFEIDQVAFATAKERIENG